jgi:hypothetical protein
MIQFEHKLDGVDGDITLAIKKLWRNASPHIIQILAGKCTDEEAKHITVQGGKLEDVNHARALANLFPISAKSNRKIAKPKFAEYLKKGEGALFVITSNGFRHKNDTKFKVLLDWVLEEVPTVSLEVVENEKHATFFFHIKKKKEKEEVVEEPQIQEPESNEGA